jgi:hypothetical protein
MDRSAHPKKLGEIVEGKAGSTAGVVQETSKGIRGQRDEKQRQRQEVVVVVPGDNGRAAAVFCEGIAGGLRVVRGGFCGFRASDCEPVYVAEELGSGGGTGRGKRPSGGSDGETQHVGGRRSGSTAIAATGFSRGAANCGGAVVQHEYVSTLQGTHRPG